MIILPERRFTACGGCGGNSTMEAEEGQEQMARPHVTVVLVNWNGRSVTIDCLRSLQSASYPGLSTVVVDNASTDGSVEAIRAEFPGIGLLVMSENLRFAGGNNVGIRKALDEGADMVMLLNNDTVVDPHFADFLVERLENNPRCGMTCPKILYVDDPQRIWFAGGAVSMWSGTMRHIGIREVDHGQHDLPHPTAYATGCCILARAEAIRKVGLLDETYFMYAEDADWSLRFRRAGYTIVYEPRAKVWHKLSVSAGGHLSWFKLTHKELSSLRFFARYARWYHWLVFPWLHIAATVWTAVRYAATVR